MQAVGAVEAGKPPSSVRKGTGVSGSGMTPPESRRESDAPVLQAVSIAALRPRAHHPQEAAAEIIFHIKTSVSVQVAHSVVAGEEKTSRGRALAGGVHQAEVKPRARYKAVDGQIVRAAAAAEAAEKQIASASSTSERSDESPLSRQAVSRGPLAVLVR